MSTLFLVEALKEGFIGILLTLDTLIYGLIGSAFKIFMALAGARLLSSDTYFEIANKIYVVVGVLMLFVLAYAILRGIIDPDQASKGEFGPKMIKNVVIAVLGLALAPTIFNLMYQGQGLILEQDVLGKLFFRIDSTDKVSTAAGDVNPDEYVKQIGGSVTATSLWQAFFHPAPDSGMEASDIKVDASGYFLSAAGGALACGAGIGVMAAAGWTGVGLLVGGVIALVGCSSAVSNTVAGVNSLDYSDLSLADAYNLTAGGETFGIYTAFLANYADEGEIEYLFGISTVAGAFALYAFISFSIDMGIRAAKLAYLQIIAPVPLVMQVLPKFKENFKKYTGSVISTFLEVFIRISVVYVVVYIICHLSDMFSSADALWGNADLSAPELLFAYAFLILGLIAFCRKAPEMITQTLGIPKGDMHLGIGKKLAAGGAFSAGSVAYGGVTSAVRNWNDNKGKGIGKKVTSALGGMGSGMWRATRENFIGPNHKEAQTWADLKNVGERAAQGATDARLKRDERKENHAEAVKTMEAAKAKRDAAQAAYDASGSAADDAKLKQAIAEYNDAVARVGATTALGSFVDNLAESAKAWSVGTVSTEKEEAAMKFGSDLDGLKGKLRDEAYKKNEEARRLYTAYNNLKSAPINEYAEGWDESAANTEYRRRKAAIDSDSALSAAITDMHNKRDNLQSIIAAGGHAGEARYDAAKLALDGAKSTLESSLSRHGISNKTITDDGTFQMIGDIKIDPSVARRQRDQELEGLRIAMEAAADAFVHSNASDKTSNTYRDIASFLSEHASYIGKNGSMQITVGYDSNNNPIKETLGKVLEDSFGKSAQQGKFVPDDDFKKQNGIKIKFTSSVTQGGQSYSEVVYKLEGDKYIPYGVDASGGEVKLDPANCPSYDKKTFFDSIAEQKAKGIVDKASSDTAVSRASDKGKTSATYIRNNEYAEKVSRKRQVQDAKGGGGGKK